LIYSIEAGQYLGYNLPTYLSSYRNKNDEKPKDLTVSNFANNVATLLGLSSDQTEKEEPAIFYSKNPFEIPSPVWILHVEGVDKLSDDGILLEDNVEFDIESISSKLSHTGSSNELTTGSILISLESDINNLGGNLQNQISQMDKQASIKYVVIVCDDCNNDKSIQQIQTQLKITIDQIVATNPQTLAITLTTKESARVRRARQVERLSANVTIATMYSDEYPTMFNLFFLDNINLCNYYH